MFKLCLKVTPVCGNRKIGIKRFILEPQNGAGAPGSEVFSAMGA